MRALIWVSVLAMGLWSGYWFVGHTAVHRAADAFFASAASQGLRAEHRGLSVRGFPSRFDVTVTEPSLVDVASDLGWQAPFVQIFSLSYKPWHLIAAFAPTQLVTTPVEEVTVTSGKLQASVVLEPGKALALDRTTLVGEVLGLTSTLGWSVKAGELRFATRRDVSRANTHEIGLTIEEIEPDPSLAALAQGLPAKVGRLHLDAFVGFSAPIDRHSGETRPEITAVEIKEASLIWGELSGEASGDLAFSAGVPEGRVEISLRGWRRLLPMIEASGVVKPEVMPTLERMMETLATQSGDPKVLKLPLIFTRGQMRLGPLPLGPVPQF